MMHLETLEDLWERLGDVPLNMEEEIEENFYIFDKGTNIYEIWKWFEEQNDEFYVTL